MGKRDEPSTGEDRGPLSPGRFPAVPAFDRTEDRHRFPPISNDNLLPFSDQGQVAGQSVF